MKFTNDEQRAINAVTWIKTLQVCNDKQGKGQLGSSGRGYCCLGLGAMINDIPFEHYSSTSGDFKNRVGLINLWGKPRTVGPYMTSLTGMNDTFSKTFEEIGKHLELNHKRYFTPDVSNFIGQILENYE